MGSLTLAILEWRKNQSTRPRDPPFEHPELDEGDEESTYEVVPPLKKDADDYTESPFSDYRYSAASSTVIGSAAGYSSPGKHSIPSAPQPRPSLDAYGAFSDPPPSGFAPPSDNDLRGVSRTMQYADPYAAVRASVASVPSSSPSAYQ